MGEGINNIAKNGAACRPQQRHVRLAVDGGEDGRFGEDGILRRLMIRITE
jgi:hypothetical protein